MLNKKTGREKFIKIKKIKSDSPYSPKPVYFDTTYL